MKDIFKSLKQSLKNLSSTGNQSGALPTHHHEKHAKTEHTVATPTAERSAAVVSPRATSEMPRPGLSRHSTRQDVVHSSLPSSSRQTPRQPALAPPLSTSTTANKEADVGSAPQGGTPRATPRSLTPPLNAVDLYSSSALASTPRRSSDAAHAGVGNGSGDDADDEKAPPMHLILSDHQSPSSVPLLATSPDDAIQFTLVNERGVSAPGSAKVTAQSSPRAADAAVKATAAAVCEGDRQRSSTPFFVMSPSGGSSPSRPATPVFQEQSTSPPPAAAAAAAAMTERAAVPHATSRADTTAFPQITPPLSPLQNGSNEDSTVAPRQTSSTRAAAASRSSRSDECSTRERQIGAEIEAEEESKALQATPSSPATQGGSTLQRPSRHGSRLDKSSGATTAVAAPPRSSSVHKPASDVVDASETRVHTPLPSPAASRASSVHHNGSTSAAATPPATMARRQKELTKPRSASVAAGAARHATRAAALRRDPDRAAAVTRSVDALDEDDATHDEKTEQRRKNAATVAAAAAAASAEVHMPRSHVGARQRTASHEEGDTAAATTRVARHARLPRRDARSVSPLLRARHVAMMSPLAHRTHYRHSDHSVSTASSLSSSLSSAYRQVSRLPMRHSRHRHRRPWGRERGRDDSAHSHTDGSSGRHESATRSRASASLTRAWRDGERRRGRFRPTTPFHSAARNGDDGAEDNEEQEHRRYDDGLADDDGDGGDYRRGNTGTRHLARRHAASASRERRTPPRVAYNHNSSSLASRRSRSNTGSMTGCETSEGDDEDARRPRSPHRAHSLARRHASVRPLEGLLSSEGYSSWPHDVGSAHSEAPHRLSATPRRPSRHGEAATPRSPVLRESQHAHSRTSSRRSANVADGEPVRDDGEVQDLLQEIEAELAALAASIDYHESLRDQDMVANPWTRLYHLNNRQERQAREARLRQYEKLHRVRHMLLSGELDRRLARRERAVRQLDARLRDPNNVFQRLYASTSYPGSRRARSADDSRGDASTATTTLRGGRPPSSTGRSHATSTGRSAKEVCLNLYADGRAKWTRLQERRKAALAEQEREELNELLVGRLAGELERKAAATPRHRTPLAPDAWLQQARTLLPQRIEQDGDAAARELLRGPRLTAAEQESVTRRLAMHSNARALERLAAEREKRLKEECTFRPTINEMTGRLRAAGARGGRRGVGRTRSASRRRSHGRRMTSDERSDRLSDSASSGQSDDEAAPVSKVDRCSLLYKKAAQTRRQRDEWRAARARETRLQILRERMKNDHHFRRRVELDPSLADRFMRSLVV